MPFIRPSLKTLFDRTITDFESEFPGADARLRRSNLNVFAFALSNAVHSLYAYLDYIARQVLPDTAETDVLERHGSLRKITRKAAAFAVGETVLTGTNGTAIPAATRLKRADGFEYETVAEVTIASGSATASFIALEAGKSGNAVASTTLNLVTPIAGINAATTVTSSGITSGSDIESDDSLRARVLQRIQQPPQGGADHDYIAWALEVPGVTRAWVYPRALGLGTVLVRFVRDDDVSLIPGSTDIANVQAHIESLYPNTVDLTVVAPIAVPLNFSIQLTPNTQAVRDAVTAELTDLLRREAEPNGAILISHIREAISLASGESNHVLSVPSADVTHTGGQIATMGVITWL